MGFSLQHFENCSLERVLLSNPTQTETERKKWYTLMQLECGGVWEKPGSWSNISNENVHVSVCLFSSIWPTATTMTMTTNERNDMKILSVEPNFSELLKNPRCWFVGLVSLSKFCCCLPSAIFIWRICYQFSISETKTSPRAFGKNETKKLLSFFLYIFIDALIQLSLLHVMCSYLTLSLFSCFNRNILPIYTMPFVKCKCMLKCYSVPYSFFHCR